MARPCGCVDPGFLGCQCSFASSESIAVTGAGSAGDPAIPAAIIDPAAGNQLVEGVNGLGVFQSVALQRMLNPARGILYLLSATPATLSADVTVKLLYDNSDVAGGMTTDGAKAYLITPYSGVYIATFYYRLPVSGPDTTILTVRISDEDSDGEVAAMTTDGDINHEERVIGACSSAVNLDAARRIRTQVNSSRNANCFDGTDLAYTAKFTLNYVGPGF